MVEAGGIGKGRVATAAEVMDSSSTGRCNGRQYSSSVAITRDIRAGGGARCQGGNDGINLDVLAFGGQGLGLRQIPLCVFFFCFWCEKNIRCVSACESKFLTDIYFYVTDIPHSTRTLSEHNLIKWCH